MIGQIKYYEADRAQDESNRIREKAIELAENRIPSTSDYWSANDFIDAENRLAQGKRSSEVFSGNFESKTVREIYTESAKTISDIIRERLNPKDKTYRFADFGSNKGELMEKVLDLLPEYDFHTIALDSAQILDLNDVAKEKIPADLARNIPLENESIDIGMMRYVLQWNTPEKQLAILKEISRTCKDFIIVQHAGADSDKPEEWREKMDELLSGNEVKDVKRSGHFFSSRDEVEKLMTENGISFERLIERRVEKMSNVFIEKYGLNESDAETTQNILENKDYIIQTTWIVIPNNRAKKN